jgi:hypothetical protein
MQQSNVADALGNIAESDTGRQSCIDAGAPLALVTLSGEKSVKENVMQQVMLL